MTRIGQHRAVVAVCLMLAASAVGQAAPARQEKAPWQYLQEPSFRASYAKALGSKASTRWIARRDGPAPEDRFVDLAGERYVLAAFCKPHDCGDNNAVILYSPRTRRVYGLIHETGIETLIGSPSAELAAELAALWRTEWRSTPR